MPPPVPLSLADAAWLGMDRPQHPMVITVVLTFDEPVDWSSLRGVLQSRLLARYPNFRRRLLPSAGLLGRPVWSDDPGDSLDSHLEQAVLPAPGDPAALRALVGPLLSRPLDRSHSPWQLVCVDGYRGGAAIIARLHHCLADGLALASVLLTLTDAAEPAAAIQPRQARGRPNPARVGAAVVRTGVRVLLFRRSTVRGRLGSPQRVAWTDPLDLAEVRTVASAAGATVNDALLAALAGALRRGLLARGDRAGDVRALVPVDLRHPADRSLGNRIGAVLVRLPVSVPDPVERVRAVSAETRALKGSSEAAATGVLLRLVGALPAPLPTLAARLLGAKSAAVVTTVPGPRHGVTLAGTPLTGVVFWAPRPGSTGLSVSIFRYAGTATVGIAADEALADPHVLTEAVQSELTLLARSGLGR